MKRRNLSLIISGLLGVIAILSGIYLMSASVTNYIAESQKTDWIVTEARITDVSSRVKRNSRSSTTFYDLTYQYEADGKTYTGKKSSVSGIRLVGDEIKIKYDPDNPSDSTSDITPNKDDLIYPFGGGVLFLAAGIFFLLTAIKRSKRLKNEDEAYTETSENSRNPKRTIIALLLMAAIIALTLVFLRAQPSGIETFSSVMTENGYTVSDMTDELRTDWRVGSLIAYRRYENRLLCHGFDRQRAAHLFGNDASGKRRKRIHLQEYELQHLFNRRRQFIYRQDLQRQYRDLRRSVA